MFKIIKYAAVQDEPLVINNQRPVLELVQNTNVPTEIEDIVREAKNEAEKIVNSARQQAEEVLNEAKVDAEQIKQQSNQAGYDEGYQKGYDEGIRRGMEQAANEMKDTIGSATEKAQRILFNAEKECREIILSSEREIVKIALAVARKVLAREIDENPMVVLPIVKAALEKVCDQEQINIRVNLEDYDLVLQAKRDLQIMIGRENAIMVTVDHTVKPGGCMIDTPYGTVDAGIDTQFEAVKQAIEGIMP